MPQERLRTAVTGAAVEEGMRAPEFQLADDAGETVTLSDFRGQPVVLYFYPEDDTPGCTAQACGFRDSFRRFEELDAVILGVSPDGADSHLRFRRKFKLPFPLLCDPDHAVALRYGAWGRKQLFGNHYEGILRSTFVIAPDGTIAKVFRNVRPEGHDAEVLEAVEDVVV